MAYLALAAVSGSISPLDRHPLLDGVEPAAPYRWVKPPPDLAVSNQPPLSGFGPLTVGANGSTATAVSTSDLQATVIFPPGSFAASPSGGSVAVHIVPLAPTTPSGIPSGLTLTGNVYRITATGDPSGSTLHGRIQVVLVYPLQLGVERQTVVRSSDDRTWIALRTRLSVTAQQVHAESTRLGYFAVAVRATPGAAGARSSSKVWVARLVLGGVAVVAVLVLVEWRRRRR